MNLTDTDIKEVSVLLPSSAKNYVSTKAQLVGGIVVKSISRGDLIPVSAIANSTISLD
jgi:flagella basal body P-ring formation protein FlgA